VAHTRGKSTKPHMLITVSTLYSDSPALYRRLILPSEVPTDSSTVCRQQRTAALQLSALQDAATLLPLRNLTEDKNFDIGVKNKFNPVLH